MLPCNPKAKSNCWKYWVKASWVSELVKDKYELFVCVYSNSVANDLVEPSRKLEKSNHTIFVFTKNINFFVYGFIWVILGIFCIPAVPLAESVVLKVLYWDNLVLEDPQKSNVTRELLNQEKYHPNKDKSHKMCLCNII